MYNENEFLFRDPWSTSELLPIRNKNIYICISGNSGSGKSTALRLLGENIYRNDKQTIAIDEKVLHHPLLPTLFHDTQSYGFQIQINFMIQRALIIKKWIDSGYNLIMERSHLEDKIFIKHFLLEGLVNQCEFDVYMKLWECIDKRTPRPDIMLFLDCEPELSLKHINRDEDCGSRPKEFPSDDMKKQWTNS